MGGASILTDGWSVTDGRSSDGGRQLARVVKDADERRQELLDTAMKLFETEGYDRTSIDRIVDAVGIAKGTFYHYFDSKQDLLAQIVTGWADALYARLESDVDAMSGDALTRLRGIFSHATDLKLADRDATMAFARSLYADENLRLRHALMAEWLPRTDALLAPVIADGIAEGTFHVTDAESTATVLTSLWFGFGDRQADLVMRLAEDREGVERIAADLAAVEVGMERILGVEEGSLGLGLAMQMERFTEDR